jgi:hypothetical protein
MPIYRNVLKSLLGLTIIMSPYLYASPVSFSLSYENVGMNNDWSFIATNSSSFKSYSKQFTNFELQSHKFLFGIITEEKDLKAMRSSHPKEINSSVRMQGFKIGYQISPKNILVYKYQRHKVDDQFFDCYQKAEIIIGSCEESNLNISSTNNKYQILNGNLIFLEGKSKLYSLNLHREIKTLFLDSIILSFQNQISKFNWLTPLEDIRSPVILNATINNIRVGDVIQDVLNDLPPREEWTANSFSIELKKKYNFKHISLFVNNKIYYGNRLNFSGADRKSSRFNNQLESGIILKNQKFDTYIFFRHYLKFHLWKDDFLYNGRSSKYFDEMFGEIGGKVVFNF